MNTIFSKLLYLLEKNMDTVLVTLIDEDGSAPRGIGSAMLVNTDGLIIGTIGGGAVEVNAVELAKELVAKKSSMTKQYILRTNETEDIGMVCGGDVEAYFQFISAEDKGWHDIAAKIQERYEKKDPAWLIFHLDGTLASLVDKEGNVIAGNTDVNTADILAEGCVTTEKYFSVSLNMGERAIIFGGGHCAKALAPLLKTVGFRVTIFDNRADCVSRETHPTAEHLICGDYTKLSEYIDFDPEDYLVVMTNGHSFDYQVEEQILRIPSAYVGVIGSAKKTASVNARLRADGISEEAIASVHTPIGTKIKAVTPEEIAVSIAGEMIYERALKREAQGEETHGCPMH
ncbi:MAG: XdhC family protein [Firmicutes bacterium]|nr:XdhC family protein [Bacillota bacterium]